MQPAQKRTAETQRGAERRRGSVLCISSCRLLCVYVVNCLFVLLLTGIRPIAAQQAPPQRTPTYTVESQLVQIFLTVQEGSRRITGLNLSEFSLAEDGKPQPIDHMDSEQVPLQVALLFDTSESMTESLKETQEAATLFVESMKPGDRVTLIPFNSNIRTIPQLTDDFEPVLRAIRGTRAEYRTKLYDAILYAMKVLSDKEGRKAIVVFSDGGDTASTAALPLALNASSRYGYPIYTVSAGPAIRSQAFRQVLRQLAETNNGKVFFAENPRELRSAFLEVSAELRAAYVLYYYTLLQPDDRWHEFIVKAGNPRYRVYARRGFYLAKAGSAAALAKNIEKVPAQGIVDPAAAKESARAALDEVVTPPAVPRPVDREAADNSNVTVSTTKSKAPTFKVESRLVEVPVFVESINEKEPPLFSEKDFNVYEDGSRRELAYFRSALNMEDLPKARDLAMKKAGTAAPQDKPALNSSSGDELTLGKYYLVIDDLTTDVTTFAQVKKAAEALIKKYHNPIRPFTVYFTSRGRGGSATGDVETMLAEIRKANARSNRAMAETEAINVYEAVLIDRGDSQAQDLGELRTAALLGLRYQNNLGIIEGRCDAVTPSPGGRGGGDTCDPKSNEPEVRATLQGKVAELLTQNAGYVRAALAGLREVVNMAAADTGNYTKTVILISPGYVAGKDTRSDASSLLQSIAAAAGQQHVKIFAVDIGGLTSETPAAEPALGALALAPQVQTPLMEAHATEWQFEKASSLDTLSLGSGGKRVKSDNDMTAAVGSTMSSTGALYYLAFLSRQPTDGRYHKIGVFVSSRSVRLHARQGYYARPLAERPSAPSSGASSEEVNALLARVDQAMKNQDYSAVANTLEALKWKFVDKPDYWYNLGVAYFNLKDSMKAIEAFQQAWALSPEDRTTGLMLSRAFAAAGNGDAAAETLQTMRFRHPLDLELLLQLGRVYESASQPAKAYEIYRSALDISPAPPLEFYVVLIRTSALLKRYAEAGIFVNDYRSRGGAEERIEPWTRLLQRDSKH